MPYCNDPSPSWAPCAPVVWAKRHLPSICKGVPSTEAICSYLMAPSVDDMASLEIKLLAEVAIQDLDKQIHRLQEMRNDLTKELKRVKGPICRLPPELFQFIFLAY
jgi:hypothetical protein